MPRPYDCDENSPRPQDVWDQQQEDLSFEAERDVAKRNLEICETVLRGVRLQRDELLARVERLAYELEQVAGVPPVLVTARQTLAANRPDDTLPTPEQPKT